LKVVRPISPVGWQLTFDGETVTLFPSVGSWNFPCRSHYFIRRDTVVWVEDMTQYEIERGRARDQKAAISTLEYKRLSRQKHARRSRGSGIALRRAGWVLRALLSQGNNSKRLHLS
jgi:Family of unknown function (DUF6527)